jgi:beta-lactamase class C
MCCAAAQHAYAELPITTLVARTKKNLAETMAKTVGSAAAIVHLDKVLFQAVAGVEYKGGKAITADTYFALGSISKPISALVVHDLVQAGKLPLEQAITLAQGKLGAGITLAHLLSHSSGYFYRGDSDIERGLSAQKLLDKIFHIKPQVAPGKEFYYSNALYSLVIEELLRAKLGKPWKEIFREVVSTRGLGHMALGTPAPQAALAHPHYFNKSRKALEDIGPLPKNYPEVVGLSAGVFASLHDMIAYARLINAGAYGDWTTPVVVAADALAWGLKTPFPSRSLKSSYAKGWRVFELTSDSHDDHTLVFHGGYLRGVSTFIGWLPRHKVAIVILINDDRNLAQKAGFNFWYETILAQAKQGVKIS